MCGIFGTIPADQDKFEQLIGLSESRGKEAVGMMGIFDEEVRIFKLPKKGTTLFAQAECQEILTQDCEGLIGHTRLATNGSFADNRNNQPITYGGFVGMHNGIITNTDALWRILNKKPRLEVDTEVIMAWYDTYQRSLGWEKTTTDLLTQVEGAATFAVLSVETGEVVLATNTGSLYVTKDKCLFASERYILNQIYKVKDIYQIKASDFEVWKVASKKKRQLVDRSVYNTCEKSKMNTDLTKLKKHDFDYERIYTIKRCKKCILPVTTPFIEFDGKGVCNYCREHLPFRYQGKEALMKLVEPYRSKTGEADCLIGFSGGRDSSYGLHLLKTELGLNPIAYTFDWGMLSDLGRQNAARVTGKLGVEHIIVSADIATKHENIRKNIMAWMKKPDLGMVPLFMAGDKESEYHMNELIKKTGINLVVYCRGNQFEREEFKAGHCGVNHADPGGVIHHLAWQGKVQMAFYYGKQFLLNPSYLNLSLWDTAKAYTATYLIPHDYVYLWHYLPWEEKQVIKTLRDQYNWQSPADNPATWRIDDASPAFYNFIYYQVQGFTEHDSLRSHQIREGQMTRKEAWEIVCEENRPRYEALQWYFQTLKLDGNEVLEVVDGMRRLY
jgi:glutamine---fructose-6-phosphate transaminase (isomerizing)